VNVNLLAYTTWHTLLACIPIALFVMFGPAGSINWSVPLVAALFYCVVPGSIVARLIWFYALSRVPAGSVGLCALATPIIGILSAWMQMGEWPSAVEEIGMRLVVIALSMNALQALNGGKEARAPATSDSKSTVAVEPYSTRLAVSLNKSHVI
jgi:drug/metabolite transporter (DMT)-like permease